MQKLTSERLLFGLAGVTLLGWTIECLGVGLYNSTLVTLGQAIALPAIFVLILGAVVRIWRAGTRPNA